MLIPTDRRTQDEVSSEMAMLVELTKQSGGLRYSILVKEMQVETNWSARMVKQREERFINAKAMPDSNPGKAEELERARDLYDQVVKSQYEPEGALNFLKEVERGVLPANWLEIPSWSGAYPFEGIYRHHVVRNSCTMEMLVRENDGHPLTDEQIKQHILANNTVLARFLAETEQAG